MKKSVIILNSDLKNGSQIEPQIESQIECCICYRKSCKILWNTDINSPASLNEWESTTQQQQQTLDLDTFFLGPCRQHGYCVQCLRNIAIGFDNHPVGSKHSYVPCQSPFDECFTMTGMNNYFTHYDIKKILNDEEYIQYTNHVDRFQFPGYEMIKCPRPLFINGELDRCNAGILVPLSELRTKIPGEVIVMCDQNDKCNRKSCYHCQNLIGRFVKTCQYCTTMDESNNPKSENRYFYVVGKTKKDTKNICYLNEELTTEIVIDQFNELIESEKGFVKCLECLVPLYKSEQCNTLTHCKIERCYCCGRSGTRTQPELGDHWDTTGLKGCPRFDYSKYWNDFAKCEFKCEENKCYNDKIGDCTKKTHQEGIKNMQTERKRAQIYHALMSLLPGLRNKVLIEMWKRGNLKDYIPQFTSDDHRSFYPDSLKKHFLKNKEYSNLFKPLVFEKPKITFTKDNVNTNNTTTTTKKTKSTTSKDLQPKGSKSKKQNVIAVLATPPNVSAQNVINNDPQRRRRSTTSSQGRRPVTRAQAAAAALTNVNNSEQTTNNTDVRSTGTGSTVGYRDMFSDLYRKYIS